MAFLYAKAKIHEQKRGAEARANEVLYNDVSSWVMQELKAGTRKILDWLLDQKTTSHDYRRATAEALAFLNWLKRFAEAELPEPEEEGT
jgi:CRISPR-associated protein Cmr5